MSLTDLSCLAMNLMSTNFEKHHMAYTKTHGLGILRLMPPYYKMDLLEAW